MTVAADRCRQFRQRHALCEQSIDEVKRGIKQAASPVDVLPDSRRRSPEARISPSQSRISEALPLLTRMTFGLAGPKRGAAALLAVRGFWPDEERAGIRRPGIARVEVRAYGTFGDSAQES